MDLSGTWRAALADDDLRREAFAMGFNDETWQPVRVPGHWRSEPAFAEADGPLIYRTRFDWDAGATDARSWVVLDGLFYQGDVWFDGAYLGDPEGYFFPHAYEVSDLARLTDHHVLAIEVTCAPQPNKSAKRNLTGVFQDADYLDSAWNPGGLWREVHIERTGPVRIEKLSLRCREATTQRAVVDVRAILDSDRARTVRVRTALGSTLERELLQPLATGSNEVEWSFGVDDPTLWWPWSLGDQAFVTAQIDVFVAEAGDRMDGTKGSATQLSDSRTVRTGLRQVSMQDFILSVNGERLFAKGVNVAPTRLALGEAEPAEISRDVTLARDAGLDLIRVHGHIARPELYDTADELGMLVWQDLPLQRGYAHTVRRSATRMATEAVYALGHHPSLAVWCGHNEPVPITPPTAAVAPQPMRTRVLTLVRQGLPTWNKSVLDGWVKNALKSADGSRPVIAHSGVLPHLPQLDGTDSHLFVGWQRGDERDLPDLANNLPRLVRFVSEFGAQSVPTTSEFIDTTRWPNLDWSTLTEHHGLEKAGFDSYVPPATFDTFDQWRQATQAYQAVLLKHQIETLRRLKYRPTGGFAVFFLADANPAISASLLDHHRVAKPAYQAVIDSCRPVIVVAERMPARLATREAVALDIHVISDLRTRLDGLEVTAELTWSGGSHGWRWGGEVEADGVSFVGTARFVVPDAPGSLVLDLHLVSGDHVASNRYEASIARI
jgi:beta-mannosidase